jgi:hypothetical protein
MLLEPNAMIWALALMLREIINPAMGAAVV